MARNYFKRYIWLVQKLTTRPMTFKELCDAWEKSTVNDEHKPLTERTLHNTKEAISDMFGIQISCNRRTNRYEIVDDGDMEGAGLRKWMLEAMSLNSLLSECAGDKGIVQFEDIPSAGLYLGDILAAIKAGKKLKCRYQGYSMPEARDMTIHPYGLKLYQRKWYMVGMNEYHGEIHQFALDNRMMDLSVSDEDFNMPNDFSLDDFYRYRIGVLDRQETKEREVRLKVNHKRVRQFRDLPLHHSQKEIETTKEYSVFEYAVYPNTDVINAILPHGQYVEILSPFELRDQMQAKITAMLKIYNSKN